MKHLVNTSLKYRSDVSLWMLNIIYHFPVQSVPSPAVYEYELLKCFHNKLLIQRWNAQALVGQVQPLNILVRTEHKNSLIFRQVRFQALKYSLPVVKAPPLHNSSFFVTMS